MTTDADLLAARAKRLAVPIVEDTASDGHSAIVVEIDAQRYAFPLADVRRALVLGPLTELPHVPPIVLGLGTADGDVLAVFDGRVWAGGSRRPSADRTPVLILGPAPTPLALAVDRFVGSLTLPASTATAGWLQQVTEEGILIVRVGALLEDPAFSVSEGTVDDHHQED
ncbi:MAG TPA: chemotaxis protein CheW [Kofleriaceae bacterium]|nr:chemotaxis protein CheW [Kofleriaceae bacterium]